MSDSDDTDLLLLIPPNFFVVHSDSEVDSPDEPSIVDNLIHSVKRLENRLNTIERRTSGSELMVVDDFGTSEHLKRRDSLHYVSTPALRASDSHGQQSKEELLNEVDEYLGSKNASMAYALPSSGSPGRILDALNHTPNKRLALTEVDKLLQEMEATQTEIENKLKLREMEYNAGDNSKNEEFINLRRSFLNGDNIGSIPDLGIGLRESFANTPISSPQKHPDGLGGGGGDHGPVDDQCSKREAYLVGESRSNSIPVSRSPAKTTDPRRRPAFMSPRRRIPFESIGKTVGCYSKYAASGESSGDARDESKESTMERHIQKTKSSTTNHFRNNLMSLSDLWKSDSDTVLSDPIKLRQKLEEEKIRRLHLENSIQALNRRVLEEQEKLAVAMRVDEAKDKAICQITDAWKHMVDHWKEIEAERHSMSQKLIAEKSSLKRAQEDVDNKIQRWEKEVSQALDLAAGYKSKNECLESELTLTKELFEGKIKELEEQIDAKDKTVKGLLEERKSLAEKLQSSQDECQEEKKLVDMARKEVEVVQSSLSKTEAELSICKDQKEALSSKLKDEKAKTSILEQQVSSLQEALSGAKVKQTKAEEEAKKHLLKLESIESELKTLYQSELESVVRDKLIEFQGQLDAAQTAIQSKAEASKKQALEKLEQQKRTLIAGHLAEIQRLEMIHKEKVKFLEHRLSESERKRQKLENGKKDTAQKLHSVMEAQWQQVLGIISNEFSMRQNDADPTKDTDSNHGRDLVFEQDTQDHPKGRSNGVLGQHDLSKYIKMLLQRCPGEIMDSSLSSATNWPDMTLNSQNDRLLETDSATAANDAQYQGNKPVGCQTGSSSNVGLGQYNQRKPPWK